VKIEKDYEDILRLFNKYKVRYCIVGAFAVAFYARPRYTKDLDLLVSPDLRNGERIVKALNEFGFKAVGLDGEDFKEEGKIIQLGYEPVRIDLLTSVAGSSFEGIWKKRKIGTYGKEKVNFIGLEELIVNKRKSKRKQDQVDLEILLGVRLKKKKTKFRKNQVL
jgi:predicted nucleotidyltransferase